MKCTKCRYYTKSRTYGNGCSCPQGAKPCEIERRYNHSRERAKKRKNRFDKKDEKPWRKHARTR